MAKLTKHTINKNIKLLKEISSCKNLLIFGNLQQLFFKYKTNRLNREIYNLFKILIKKKKNIIVPTFNLEFPKTKKTNSSINNIQTGYLNKYLIKKFKFFRTSKPMYNYAILGPDKKKFLDLKQSTAWGEDSVIGYLAKNSSYGLAININPRLFNWLIIHYCEEKFSVPYRFYKIFKGENTRTKKKVFEKMFVRNLKKNKIEDGRKINQILIRTKTIKKIRFGLFDIFLLPLSKYCDIALKKLKKNPYYLVKNET